MLNSISPIQVIFTHLSPLFLMFSKSFWKSQDEEPRDRYKHLTILYGQTAELSIQLLATVVSHTDFLQVGNPRTQFNYFSTLLQNVGNFLKSSFRMSML